MFQVEWQKQGLPHANILIQLHDKITSNEIGDVISAEIPDEKADMGLYDIVVKKMIHGACGALDEKHHAWPKECAQSNILDFQYTARLPAMIVTNYIEKDLLKIAVKQQ